MCSPAKSSAGCAEGRLPGPPRCGDAGSGVMLVPHGCCSVPTLLLHPSPAGARNRTAAKACCPRLPGSGAPWGAPVSPSPASAHQTGRGKAGVPLVQSCLGSPLPLCHHVLSQKWEKNSPLLADALPNPEGSRQKPRRSPKRKKTKITGISGRARPALAAAQLSLPPEAPGCRVVPGLAPSPCHAK